MALDSTDSGTDIPTNSDINFNPDNYMAGLDNGSMLYQDVNWGDLGYGGDPNDFNGSGGLNDLFLKNLGWKGQSPWHTGQTFGNDNQTMAAGDYSGYTPEFKQFINNNGINFKQGGYGDTISLQGYGSNGQSRGTPFQEKIDPENAFNYAMMALTSAAGGAAGGALAGGAGYGAGTAVGAASSGAGAGLASGLAQGSGEIGAGLKGAAIGGVSGGAAQGLDAASLSGVTDPMYSRAINGAVGAGVRSGMTGGNIGSSVLGSLGTSGLSAAGQTGMGYLNNMDSDPYANENVRFGNYPAPQEAQGGYSQAPWANQSTFDRLTGAQPGEQNYSVASGFNPDNPNSQSASSMMGSAPSQQTDNPVKAHIMSALNSVTQGGAPGRMDNMASNLMDLYNRYRNNSQQGGLASNLSSMYGPNSPYAQQMNKALMRSDARSGRRTQIGSRQVELQARLAEANSRNAPLLNQMYGQMSNNRNAGQSDIPRPSTGGPNGGGGMDMLRNYGGQLSNYLNPQTPTAAQNPDWAPGD